MTPAEYLRSDRDQAKRPTLSEQAHSLIDRAWFNGYAAATDNAITRLAFLAAVDAKSLTKAQLVTEIQSAIRRIEKDFEKRI